jgi:hypothetical protein
LHMIFTFWSCSKHFFLHAVSTTPQAPCMRYQWYRMHTCMRCQWYRMHCECGINDTACIVKKILISSRIRIYIWKGFSPLISLIRSRGRIGWWKKPRVENLVTLSLSAKYIMRRKISFFGSEVVNKNVIGKFPLSPNIVIKHILIVSPLRN